MIFILPPYLDDNVREVIKFDNPELEELWLPINYNMHPEIKQVYFISTYGRVFSNGKVNFTEEKSKYLKQEISDTGYLRVSLIGYDNLPHHQAVHRLVMEAFCPIDNMENLIVNHLNLNPLDNRLSNLEWTDGSGNAQHAIYHNQVKWRTGDDCSWSSINSEKAEEIAQLISTQKYKMVDIEWMTHTKKSVVINIANGISWREYYEKYKLYKYRKPVRQVFTKEQKDEILEYIIMNIHKYDSSYYRALCMDICKDVLGGIKLNRTLYIELMDIILIYLDQLNLN